MYLISKEVCRGSGAELWGAGVERSVVVPDINFAPSDAAAPVVALVVVVKVQRGDVLAEHDHISMHR